MCRKAVRVALGLPARAGDDSGSGGGGSLLSSMHAGSSFWASAVLGSIIVMIMRTKMSKKLSELSALLSRNPGAKRHGAEDTALCPERQCVMGQQADEGTMHMHKERERDTVS